MKHLMPDLSCTLRSLINGEAIINGEGGNFTKKMINGETLINRKGGIYQNESNKRGGYLDILSILNKENGGKSK